LTTPVRRCITKESNVQKVSRIAAYALGGLFCVALAPQAGAQCSVVGDAVICTQDFGTFSTDVAHNNQTGTLSQFNSANYIQPGGALDPLISVTLTLTGVTTGGTLQNTSGTNTETGSVTELVGLSASGASGASTLTIGAFNSQLGPQSLTLAPGASGTLTGTGTGIGNSPSNGGAAVLADFTGPGTFTVTFNSGAAFTSVTGATDFSVTGNPTEDVIGSVTYNLQFAPVPELPSSLGLAALVLGGGALGLRARRRPQA